MSSLVSFWGKQVTEGTFGAFLAVEVAVSLKLVFGASSHFVIAAWGLGNDHLES